MSRVIGVDVGGTFTDIFYLDEASGRCEVAKVPTTPADQSEGVRAGIAAAGARAEGLDGVVHGTTVGTNALLTRRGAPTGLITTRGFRDVLEMRRRDRPTTWGLWGQYQPIVPRDLRLEVDERVLADGSVLEAVDLDQVEAAAQALLARGVQALSLFFINAYANPANELAALARIRALWPNAHISASSQILPEIREFERCSTTTLNAYLQPTVGEYLGRLQQGLSADGFAGELLIVQSNGGVMAVETASALPVRTALSGPAAGVIAGAHIAHAAGYPDVITCDMGGTSFDVSLVAGGRHSTAAQTAIAFGMVVRTPMIEIVTIGAGGGSIARVDRGGLLEVGPDSAGSDPGPACYGLGNPHPTVTDANLVLGRINGASPIGGMLGQLDVAAARDAIARDVGTPLGLDVNAAAEAIVRVANAHMADAIRLVSVERGHDPKRFAAMPFGGGGALHVGALITEVGLARALVPRFPGVTSALGCVVADMRHDTVQTVNAALDALDPDALAARAQAMAASSEAVIQRANVDFERIETAVELDMLYQGQTHTVSTPVEVATGFTRDGILAAFEAAYSAAYGRTLEGLPARVINLRVAVTGRRPRFDLSLLAPPPGNRIDTARTGTREVWVNGGPAETAVYDRLALPVGARIDGPAIFEQSDATTFLDPGLQARVDDLGNLVVERR
jgi:N-methylhydantoinase A